MKNNAFCNDCETVSHCSKNGCISKVKYVKVEFPTHAFNSPNTKVINWRNKADEKLRRDYKFL